MRDVDVQYGNRCAATSGESDHPGTVPRKMPLPPLAAGIEEHDHPACDYVAATQIARFSEIAIVARPGERLGIVRAAVLFGNDVLDVERIKRQVILMEVAILAAPPGTRADQR